jgi:hypothetical protein
MRFPVRVCKKQGVLPGQSQRLARISHQLSTAAADPGMSTALRSVGRLVSMPACAASQRELVEKSGLEIAARHVESRSNFWSHYVQKGAHCQSR